MNMTDAYHEDVGIECPSQPRASVARVAGSPRSSGHGRAERWRVSALRTKTASSDSIVKSVNLHRRP